MNRRLKFFLEILLKSIVPFCSINDTKSSLVILRIFLEKGVFISNVIILDDVVHEVFKIIKVVIFTTFFYAIKSFFTFWTVPLDFPESFIVFRTD